MDAPLTELSADELVLRSADEPIKQATDPFLSQVEDLCALIAGGTEMGSAGNSGASGSGRNDESVGPSGSRQHMVTGVH